MLRYIYIITSALALSVYGYMALTGHEFGSEQRDTMDASKRHTAGYRTFVLLHSGPHGGK
jgi:hypothetical protein